MLNLLLTAKGNVDDVLNNLNNGSNVVNSNLGTTVDKVGANNI